MRAERCRKQKMRSSSAIGSERTCVLLQADKGTNNRGSRDHEDTHLAPQDQVGCPVEAANWHPVYTDWRPVYPSRRHSRSAALAGGSLRLVHNASSVHVKASTQRVVATPTAAPNTPAAWDVDMTSPTAAAQSPRCSPFTTLARDTLPVPVGSVARAVHSTTVTDHRSSTPSTPDGTTDEGQISHEECVVHPPRFPAEGKSPSIAASHEYAVADDRDNTSMSEDNLERSETPPSSSDCPEGSRQRPRTLISTKLNRHQVN